jgi:ribulose-5-phosphate 4-epimerase/fuculose-1-phosphate aldolase
MKPIPGKVMRRFAAECRRVVAFRLVQCSSGNLSWRIGEDRMLIKCNRAWMGEMTAADVAVCRISDGAPLNGKRPSVELGFHAGILRERPDVNVVLHYQTPCATAAGCMSGKPPNYFVIPEIPYYIGPIGEAPFLLPGSEALAKAVTAVMRTHNLAQMRNHGQVTAAGDFSTAIQNAVFFELACEIVLRGGGRVRPMAAAFSRALRQAARRPKGNV